MRHEDLLPNGQRQTLLKLAGAAEAGVVIPPPHDRSAVKLVERGYATAYRTRYTITDAGWAWLREALAGRVPARIGINAEGAPDELRRWRQVRSDFADAGVRLPDID